MSLVIEDVLVRRDPVGRRLPVLFDSPHSGSVYPPDFAYVCPLPVLRQAEDAHVEALFAEAPAHGATLLHALFPRTYIDPNRAEDDLDGDFLDTPWPVPLRPTAKAAVGLGLIRTLSRPGTPLYHRRLGVAEVEGRLARYYRPYHAQMAGILDGFAAEFGAFWHVDCHSMPSLGEGGGSDFVIGDRDGTTSERAFVVFVAEALRGYGYAVAINRPYKGVELVARYGVPACGRHSIQLEINRRLYMNEETLEPHVGFPVVRRDLTALIREICAFAEGRLARRAAE